MTYISIPTHSKMRNSWNYFSKYSSRLNESKLMKKFIQVQEILTVLRENGICNAHCIKLEANKIFTLCNQPVITSKKCVMEKKNYTYIKIKEIYNSNKTQNNKISSLVPLDMEKIFDTVWYQTLIIKYWSTKFPYL